MESSILGKRKYQVAFHCDDEDVDEDVELYVDKLPDIPKFSKELFETADGLQQILLWFEEYNKCILRQQLLREHDATQERR